MVYIHGNYVGPNWSGGKKQGSIPYGRLKAIDDFDLSAKFHDDAYATWPKNKLSKADHIFYKHNIGKGAVRTAAALAVKAQGLLRPKQAPATPKSLKKRVREEADEEGTPTKKKQKKEINSNKSPNTTNNMPKKYGRKRVSQRSSTSGKRRANKRKTGRKSKMSFKRTKSNPLVKVNTGFGSSTMYEIGRTMASTNESVHLGHHDLPAYQLSYNFVQACFKTIMHKNGIYFGSFAQALEPRVVGDRIRMVVKTTYAAHAPTDFVNIDHVIVGTDVTYAGAVAAWYAVYETTINAASKPNTWQILELVNIPGQDFGAAQVNINMRGARLTIYTKSIFRMQNRTLAGLGGPEIDPTNRVQTDRVDINPLIGKGYGGKGNGSLFQAELSARTSPALLSDREIIASADWGLINVFQDNNGLEDPLPAYFYPQCKKEKKHIKIMPGQTIKSYINGSYRILVDEMFQKLYPNEDNTQMNKMGQFKFYHLEREITTNVQDANITVAIEHNFEIGVKLSLKRALLTVPFFIENRSS